MLKSTHGFLRRAACHTPIGRIAIFLTGLAPPPRHIDGGPDQDHADRDKRLEEHGHHVQRARGLQRQHRFGGVVRIVVDGDGSALGIAGDDPAGPALIGGGDDAEGVPVGAERPAVDNVGVGDDRSVAGPAVGIARCCPTTADGSPRELC